MTSAPSEQTVFAEALLHASSSARACYLDAACSPVPFPKMQKLTHSRQLTVCSEDAFASAPVIGSSRIVNHSTLQQFEGMWLASPSGSVVCAKIIKGELLIPYARSGEPRLAGHFYKCRAIGQTLFGRFEQFSTGESGVLFLSVGANSTLKGGWWKDESIPARFRQDVSSVTESLPGMVRTVWVRMAKARTPSWATQYFLEWPPNESNNAG